MRDFTGLLKLAEPNKSDRVDDDRKKRLRRRVMWLLGAAAAPLAGYYAGKGAKKWFSSKADDMYADNIDKLHKLMSVVKGDDEQLTGKETTGVFSRMGRHYSHGDPSGRRLFLIGSRFIDPKHITAENGFLGDFTISPFEGLSLARVMSDPKSISSVKKRNAASLGFQLGPDIRVGDTFLFQKGLKNGRPSFSNSVLLHEVGHNSTIDGDVSPNLRKKSILESLLNRSSLAKFINPSVDLSVKEEERAWRNAGKMGFETGRPISEAARKLALGTYYSSIRGEAAGDLSEKSPRALTNAGLLAGVGLGAYGVADTMKKDDGNDKDDGKDGKKKKRVKGRSGNGRSQSRS